MQRYAIIQQKHKYYDKAKKYIQTKVNGIKLIIYGTVNNQLIYLCFSKHLAIIIVTHATQVM